MRVAPAVLALDARAGLAGWAAVVLAVAGLAACTVAPAPPPPTPGPSARQHRPLWTVRVAAVELAQVAGDHVVVLTHDSLVVLDRRTGAERWRQRRPEASTHHGVPVHVADDAIVTFDGHPRSVATVYDLATGARRYSVPGRSAMPTRDGLLVAACPVRAPCELSSRDLRTGRPLWTTTVPAPAEFVCTRSPTWWPGGRPCGAGPGRRTRGSR